MGTIFHRIPLVLALGASLAVAQENEAPAGLRVLIEVLAKSNDPSTQLNLLRGISAGLKSARGVAAPAGWDALAEKLSKSENAEIREQAQTIGAIFGTRSALDAMRKLAADPKANPTAREKAIESLVAGHDRETLPLLLELTNSANPMRRAAIRGLGAFEGEAVPAAIVSAFPSLTKEEQRDAVATLLARAEWTRALVAAIDAKQIPISAISAAQARQLPGFKDPAINDWLKRNPALITHTADKQAEIARLKTILTADAIKAANPARGRVLFTMCATCHTLFDTGGQIGPELTGANRKDVDYLLQNIVDPNALIGKDYQTTTVETKDGRLIVGLIRGEDANGITVRTLAEQIVVPRGDIKSVTTSDVSMMPEGLISALPPADLCDLFAYLASDRQVPLAAP